MQVDPQLTLASALQALSSGDLTPGALIDKLCDVLESREPEIQAFLPETGRRERLHRDLMILERKYPEVRSRPPLFAIPVGVKDLYRVDDFPTKAGSKLPEEVFRGNESTVVSGLKKAGALILGKTVTTEFAYFEPGPTRNPLNIEHTPGGSSSGSAAAVAAGYCPMSLGTQTIGSVIRPAAYCGIIGFKPSQGRMSVTGIVPFSPTVDQAGFFVNDIASLEIGAATLVEKWQLTQADQREQLTLALPAETYLEQCDRKVIAAFRNDVKELTEKGVNIVRIDLLRNIGKINQCHNELIAREFFQVHENWYSKFSQLYSPRSAELFLKGSKISDKSVKQVLEQRMYLREEIDLAMKQNRIIAVLSPATSSFAPAGLNSTGSPIINLPWTYAGVPVLNLPGNKVQHGLFSGLQLAASQGQDEELIELARSLQNLRK